MDRFQLTFGDLMVDLGRYRVLLANEPIALSYRDYALLAYLASRAGQIVSNRRLLEEGLGRHDPGGLRTVDERIRHLKHMIERDGRQFIEKIESVGYRFSPREAHFSQREFSGHTGRRIDVLSSRPPSM